MSDNPSHQSPAASRKFIPELKPLESRLLLSQSQKLIFPDGTSFVFSSFPHLPRTGGVSVQNGTVLGIGVGQVRGNTVNVTDDGNGDVQTEWNRGPGKSFTGIESTVIEARRATSNQIIFNLAGSRTGPTAVAVGSQVATEAVSASAEGHPLRRLALRTSGSAFQNGSILTVNVHKRESNLVEMTNNVDGSVEVQWNGGPVRSFTGITTIVVDTRKATNDLIALDDVTA